LSKESRALLLGFQLAGLVGCSADKSVGDEGVVGSGDGVPPSVFIEVPSDGSMVDPAATIAVEARISDDGTAPEELKIAFESSLSGSLEYSGSTDSYGQFVGGVTLGSGLQTLTLTATDESGLTGFDSVEIDVNGAPGGLEIAISPEIPEIGDGLVGVVLTDAVDPEDDRVTYLWSWEIQATPDAGVVTYNPPGDPESVPPGLTDRGQAWTVTATPSDSKGNVGESASASVLVGNEAPSAVSAVIEPDPAYTNDTLAPTVTGWFDPDDDPENYRYEWSINGTVVEGAESTNLSSSLHQKGDSIVVAVTPYDGFVSGDSLVTPAVVIQNTPPSALSASIVPFSPTTTESLSVIVVSWVDDDGDAEQYEYRWFIDGVEVPTETTDTFSAALTEHFQEITVEVTPFDGEDYGDAILSAPVMIENTAPALIAVDLSPDDPSTTDAITATPSGWSDLDGDEPEYAYSWTVNGVVAPTTGLALSPSLTQRYDEVQCTVTPTDGDTEGTPIASEVVMVVNTPPSLGSASVTPIDAVYGDTLYCTWSTFVDADSDEDLSTVTWEVDGVASGSGPTLTSGFHGGQTAECIVTPFDGIDSGSSVSASLTIGNTAPSIDAVTIAPHPAFAASTLSCNWEGFSDVDGDSDASTVTWDINGVSAGTGTDLTGGFIDDDIVTCTVTPSDGSDVGLPVSESIDIANTAPSVDLVNITPATADYSDTLSCIWSGFHDDDGDSDFSLVQWHNGEGVILGEEDTLPGTLLGGESVTCTVTPHDGKEGGVPVTSAPLVIENSPPTLEAVSLTPIDPTVEDVLSCIPGVTTDPDETTDFTYAYTWEVGGVFVPGATDTTLSSVYFARGQSVYCIVTPSDGVDSGDPVNSNIVIVRNSIPTVESVSITPEVAHTNTVLLASSVLFDADDDTVFALYSWLVNGIPILEGTSAVSLNGAAYFNKGDEVRLLVTASDFESVGVSVTSDTIIIWNTPPGSPSIEILPGTPEPEDALVCSVVSDAPDVDDDTITYTYAWYLDGTLTTHTSSTVDASATAHDQSWECEVTAYDDEEAGGSATTTIAVNDLTNPDPPVFDDLAQHTNDTVHTLSGDCEADCTIDIFCVDDTTTETLTSTCSAFGRFSDEVSLTRGDISACAATCTDEADNESGPSSTFTIESCSPFDEYEDESGYGDSAADVVDEFAIISDAGDSTITIQGNVLDDDDADWFVISTSDDLTADIAAGIDYFNFNVQLTTGATDYQFVVHKGGSGAGDLECSSISGYTEYNWFVEDVGDSGDGVPSDTRTCSGSTVYGLNHCEDNSDEFYVHVSRLGASITNCDPYQLSITNGVW
jgi:hypothetical protein